MASKGRVGLDIDVARVPLREADMEPFEIMISESQERMLCVVEPQLVPEVLSVCEKWEVLATAIGEVTDAHSFRIFKDDELVGELPVPLLVDDCPPYDLSPVPVSEPLYGPTLVGGAPLLTPDADASQTLLALLGSANNLRVRRGSSPRFAGAAVQGGRGATSRDRRGCRSGRESPHVVGFRERHWRPRPESPTTAHGREGLRQR